MIQILKANSKKAQEALQRLQQRGGLEDKAILATVEKIVSDVKQRKDEALLYYTRQLDAPKITLEQIRISQKGLKAATTQVSSEFLKSVKLAKERIYRFHQRQLQNSWILTEADGAILGQLIKPLQRVGICVPSVAAPLVSSLIMATIPAKVAGVEEVIVCTAPRRDGSVDAHFLAAAYECEVDEFYKVGGAQAVAAMAYGTETIKKVDKIVGPGNLYSQLAKKLVYGIVDIDKLAGPSEVLVIADSSANPSYVAADLIAQAEHQENNPAILVTTSADLAKKVDAELEKQVAKVSRKRQINASLKKYGVAFIVEELQGAVNLANQIAPEHIEVHTENPSELLGSIRNAGAIFLGDYSPEAVGDYIAGPNHILPTGGAARFSSPLGVDDFAKRTSVISYTKTALDKVKSAIITLANVEGLDAHAASVKIRE